MRYLFLFLLLFAARCTAQQSCLEFNCEWVPDGLYIGMSPDSASKIFKASSFNVDLEDEEWSTDSVSILSTSGRYGIKLMSATYFAPQRDIPGLLKTLTTEMSKKYGKANVSILRDRGTVLKKWRWSHKCSNGWKMESIVTCEIDEYQFPLTIAYAVRVVGGQPTFKE